MKYSRLIGIYNADGGLFGEMAYIAKKVVGAGSCSLCDITHTLRGEKSEWKAACSRIPVTIDVLHRNEIDADVRRAVAGRYPCVVGVDADGPRIIIEPAELDALAGDVSAFEALLSERLA